MAKDETEIGITGKPIPKKKRSPKKQHEFEKKRRENLGQNVGGITYRSDVSPNFNPRSVREEVISYLLDEGFASDEKSAQAIAGAMSEAWVESIVESSEEQKDRLADYWIKYNQKYGGKMSPPLSMEDRIRRRMNMRKRMNAKTQVRDD